MDQDKKDQPSPAAITFGKAVKQVVKPGQKTWDSNDSADVLLNILRSQRDRNGEPVQIFESSENEIRNAFDAKRLQLAKLDREVDKLGVELPTELREFISRLLNPSDFKQELISMKLAVPAKKRRSHWAVESK